MTTRQVNRILVPIDFSETASRALRYASELARALGASLTVVHSNLFSDFTAALGGWNPDCVDRLKGDAEEALQLEAGANIDPAVPYDTVVRIATPIDGILAQSLESAADLVVMGTQGRTGFRRLVLGSVTEALMRRSEVPVIAIPVHGATVTSIGTIVCPVIYNAQCFEALEVASKIAPPDARFILLRSTTTLDPHQLESDLMELRSWIPQEIAGRCEFEVAGPDHLAAQTEELARYRHADLIVAAEPCDRTVSADLHGTFAARVMQHAECPVLSVNGRSITGVSVDGKRETAQAWSNE